MNGQTRNIHGPLYKVKMQFESENDLTYFDDMAQQFWECLNQVEIAGKRFHLTGHALVGEEVT